MLLRILLIAALGYFLGGLNGAILVSRFLYRDDVRSHGSGNAGLTNFLRAYGGPATALVIIIDLGKVFLACWLGGMLLGQPQYLAEGQMLGGTASIMGHMFPVFFKLQGGKGVLSTGALALFMDWRIFAVLFTLFLLVVLLTRYVSLGSIIATTLLPIAYAICFWGHWWVLLLSLMAWFDVYRHRANIRRLLTGTESKFSFSRH